MSKDSDRILVTRRTFLLGALATATAPAVFSTTVTQTADQPNDRMLLGCIGVGRMGRGDMRELILRGLDNNAHVVAVCDVDSKRLDLAKQLVEKTYASYAGDAAKPTECATYADYRELIARPDIDGVLIVTPDHWHAPIAVAAAKARKDIYLEKPLTYTIAEGQALVRAVRDNKCILQVGSQHRSGLYVRRGCELVRNGVIGELRTIRVGLPSDKGIGNPAPGPVPANLDYNMWLGPTPDTPYDESRIHSQGKFDRPGWLQVERYCRGMITGWGAHMNDMAQWGNGSDATGLVEIEASGEFPSRGVYDVHTTYQAEGKYANGVRLIQKTGEPGARFEGDKGWIFVSPEKWEASDIALLKTKIGDDGVKLPVSTNHMANFLQAMRSRKDPIAPVEVGHRSNSICVITHIAMKLGRKLQWDPSAEKFIGDEEANALLDYPHRAPWTV